MNPALTQSEVCLQTSDKARCSLLGWSGPSHKLPRLFVENGMWYCFMLGDWLTGKGTTPKQAYANWKSRGPIK